jgi:hypothetical protein
MDLLPIVANAIAVDSSSVAEPEPPDGRWPFVEGRVHGIADAGTVDNSVWGSGRLDAVCVVE